MKNAFFLFILLVSVSSAIGQDNPAGVLKSASGTNYVNRFVENVFKEHFQNKVKNMNKFADFNKEAWTAAQEAYNRGENWKQAIKDLATAKYGYEQPTTRNKVAPVVSVSNSKEKSPEQITQERIEELRNKASRGPKKVEDGGKPAKSKGHYTGGCTGKRKY